MTVRELIQQLLAHDMNATVLISDEPKAGEVSCSHVREVRFVNHHRVTYVYMTGGGGWFPMKVPPHQIVQTNDR